MATSEEKRKAIIARQAEREAEKRAAGEAPALPTGRPNWAASPTPTRWKKRGRGRPPTPNQ